MKKLFFLTALVLTADISYGAAQEKTIRFAIRNKTNQDVYYMHARSLANIGIAPGDVIKKDESGTISLASLEHPKQYYVLRLYPAHALKTGTVEEQEALRIDYNIPQSILAKLDGKILDIKPYKGKPIIYGLDNLLNKAGLRRDSLISADLKKERESYERE